MTRETELTDRKMLYRQTKDYILDKIQQVYTVGEPIPGAWLAEQLNISRYTVRRRSRLVSKGFFIGFKAVVLMLLNPPILCSEMTHWGL